MVPSVLLHDHLDGRLRPQTVLDLAAESGVDLPFHDVDGAVRFLDQGGAGSLVAYLKSFAYTVAVLQTSEALARMAGEAVEDLADDGVVYADLGLFARQGFGPAQLATVTRSALAAAFCPPGLKARLWEERIAPAYLAAGAEISQTW